MNEAGFTIPTNHPALAGHFPGNPLVPGVIILDEIMATTLTTYPELRIAGLREAKFHKPLPPGGYCQLKFTFTGDTCLRFKGYHQNNLVTEGILILSVGCEKA